MMKILFLKKIWDVTIGDYVGTGEDIILEAA
jgi:hypothetical protein